jgi:hypothetical protein
MSSVFNILSLVIVKIEKQSKEITFNYASTPGNRGAMNNVLSVLRKKTGVYILKISPGGEGNISRSPGRLSLLLSTP